MKQVKYLIIGAGISGIGGLYYVLDYNRGIWATTGQIEALGWLAVALVIFTTWRPLGEPPYSLRRLRGTRRRNLPRPCRRW